MDTISENNVNNPTENRGVVRRIAAYFRPYWIQVIAVVLLVLVTAGLGVVNPVLIRVIFDSALFPSGGEPDLDLLWIIAGIMAGVTVVDRWSGYSAGLPDESGGPTRDA